VSDSSSHPGDGADSRQELACEVEPSAWAGRMRLEGFMAVLSMLRMWLVLWC